MNPDKYKKQPDEAILPVPPLSKPAENFSFELEEGEKVNKIPKNLVKGILKNSEITEADMKSAPTRNEEFLKAAHLTFVNIMKTKKNEESKEKTIFQRRVKKHRTINDDPELMQCFEVRAKGRQLWEKARRHFLNKKPKVSLPEVLEEEAIHKGKPTSSYLKPDWTIHPNSLAKFGIYIIKALGVLYYFFFIQVM